MQVEIRAKISFKYDPQVGNIKRFLKVLAAKGRTQHM